MMAPTRRFGAAFSILLIGGTLTAPAVGAEPLTSTLEVTVTVTSACSLDTAALDFGTYASGQAGNQDVATSIAYSGCFEELLTVELDNGQNPVDGSRGMKAGGAQVLRYQLYADAARTEILGTGGEALELDPGDTGSGEIAVHGRIFSSQGVPVGSYSDTIGITLTF
jgi:spore coat protein U-like protein